mgnify:CR=1 FL=1
MEAPMLYRLVWGFLTADQKCVRSDIVDFLADDEETADTFARAKLKIIRRENDKKFPRPPFSIVAQLQKEARDE